MDKLKFFFISLFLVSLILGCQKKSDQLSEREKLINFFNKEEVTLLVTDSGLGGVSVAADVFERLKKSGVFKKASVIFFNAQPHIKSGYNSMETTEQKVAVFNNALAAIESNFNPDLILIACNTLSVLYDYTDFSKKTVIPVVGIVGTGVDLMKKKMDEKKETDVIIFATKTTVKQGKHKSRLVEMGVSPDNIFTQACPKLAGRIERDSQSDTTISLVNRYVKEAIQKLPEMKKPIYVSYNCTHYGYVDDLFRQAFKSEGVNVVQFLDPNPLMADFIFESENLDRHPATEVSIRVVSQPELPPGKLASIYSLIEPHSSQTAEALLAYTFEPDYFEWRSIADIKSKN